MGFPALPQLSAAAELFVIDLVAQHDPEWDTQFARSNFAGGIISSTPSSEPLPAEIRQALPSGLGDFSLRKLLSWLLSSVGLAERKAFLQRILQDKLSAAADSGPQLEIMRRNSGSHFHSQGHLETETRPGDLVPGGRTLAKSGGHLPGSTCPPRHSPSATQLAELILN